MRVEYVAVLGPVGLVKAGVLDSPQAPLLRALLGLLAASGAPLSPESLIGVLWRHDPPRDPRSTLHLAVSRLRTWLRASGTQVRIVTAATGYHLEGGHTDLSLFREWSSSAEAPFPALSRALELWRGRPFANVPRKRFDGRLVDALLAERDAVTIRAAQAASAQGAPAVAVSLAEPLCHAESLDEAAHAVLIEALVAVGRQGAATLVYDAIRRRLAAELGIGPGTLLQQAHLACLSDRPKRESRPRRGGGEHLVGRQEGLEQVAALLERHRVVTVIGPPGVGKSSFAAAAGGRHYPDLRSLELGALPPGLLSIDGGAQPPELVREAVERLVERHPVLVVASRPLGVSGEAIWPLRPLDPCSAELLFRRRAGEAVPGLVLSAPEQPYVEELCGQAGGLPAVIESLAALLRTFPLRELVRHASADLSSLIDGANPASARFAGGLERAWRGLSADQRDLLLRVSALRRDFSLDDLETGLNALAALVDRGLVQPIETAAGRVYRVPSPIGALVSSARKQRIGSSTR